MSGYTSTRSRAPKKMLHSFTIYGNQEDTKGNPIPYLRTTQGTQWTKAAIRYSQWKAFVRICLIDSLQGIPKDNVLWCVAKNNKAIEFTKTKSEMQLQIFFSNKAHADPDNIFKGIADALFVNDKLLSGSFDFGYDKENPRVEVRIETDLSTVST